MTIHLHAGTSKTGTTSLQKTLSASRDHIAENGLLYPTLAEGPSFNHHGLVAALRRSQRDFDAMMDAIAATTDRVLISTEMVGRLTLPEKQTLVDAIRSRRHEFKLLIYIRHPVDWVVSNTQQAIKMREAGYEESCLRPVLCPFRRELSQWQGIVGREAITVREFSRNALVGGDVVDDVLTQIGAASLIAGITRVEENEAISAAATRALSEVMRLTRAQPHPPSLSLGPMLSIGGPKFTLPDWTIGYIQASAQADIDWLAAEWGIAFDNSPRWQPEPDPLAEAFARTLIGLHIKVADLKDELERVRAEPERTAAAGS